MRDYSVKTNQGLIEDIKVTNMIAINTFQKLSDVDKF